MKREKRVFFGGRGDVFVFGFLMFNFVITVCFAFFKRGFFLCYFFVMQL